jgi:eukaryotic-like serine/threonine-protein kinase
MRVSLKLIEGPEKERWFEFHGADTFMVGRSRYAHLRLDADADRGISRTHFLLDIRPPKCIITDLDSRNGTYVNGKRIDQIDLEDGDHIRVGKSIIRVAIAGEDELPVTFFCSACGKEISEEESGCQSHICRSCEEGKDAGEEKKEEAVIDLLQPVPEPESPGHTHTCMHCQKDLSDVADADGRAAAFEFGRYLCKACFIKTEALDLPVRTLGDYDILCTLGTGILGTVYQGVHRSTRRIYAIKKIHAESIRDERAATLFEREMGIQSMAAHPNLLHIVDAGRAGIIPYFVTEFMAGGDIEKLVTDTYKGPVATALACTLTLQILNGLKALHGKGFVHRDLKPANFLLNRPYHESGVQAKITGYGLAKSFESAGNSLFDYTKTGQFGGSYMFMPPEQIFDYKHVEPPADIYAVGTTLYYMLCASYTVDFPTPLNMLMKAISKKKPRNPVEIILEDSPIPLLQRKSDVSADLAAVVDKAVTKEVDKRFQNVDAFAEALKEVMKKEAWL